jgi:hypothetical protein
MRARNPISPFQGLHPKKRILGPRPLAWALLARPFGARPTLRTATRSSGQEGCALRQSAKDLRS